MASYKDTLVSASEAKEGIKYYCPLCKEALILKRGDVNTPHFAHYQNSKCLIAMEDGESNEHLMGKEQLLNFIDKRNTHVEKYLPAINQRPDLMYQRIAFEFQCSPISRKRLRQRIEGYHQVHMKSLWILGSNYRKRFGSDSVNKFYYYIDSIGFTIFFWLVNERKLEVRYNCQYVCGKLKYQRILLNKLSELIIFIHNPKTILKYHSSMHGVISQLTKIENQIFYHNQQMLKWQNVCYNQHHNISGAPFVCDIKQVTNPIVGRNFLIWKILIVSSIKENARLLDVYEFANQMVGIKFDYPLVNNAKDYVKNEFKLLIKRLITRKIIQVKNGRFHLIRQIKWFEDYYQKLNELSTQNNTIF
ncbi:hypothetical protein AKUA2003_09270 [Apilactobacillus kunkeei]|nr:hypothetical protein AKUA2003_09270 [Apilactobacillus kunkeei]CAI2618766.1 hypothetical protein AKUA1001_09300 [Apilactobacillus kunkeei]CAI2802628.1 hypothetical protein AKUA2002_09290 [Apilactobacillus kunkeei]